MMIHRKTPKMTLFTQRLSRFGLGLLLLSGLVVVTQCDYGLEAGESYDEVANTTEEPSPSASESAQPTNTPDLTHNEGALGEWAPISSPTPLVQVRDENQRPAEMKTTQLRTAGHGVPEPWREDESE